MYMIFVAQLLVLISYFPQYDDPIIQAIKHGDKGAIEKLLKEGVALEESQNVLCEISQDRFNDTEAVHLAKLLIQNGANVTVFNYGRKSRPIGYVTHPAVVQHLIETYDSPIDFVNDQTVVPLYEQIRNPHSNNLIKRAQGEMYHLKDRINNLIIRARNPF